VSQKLKIMYIVIVSRVRFPALPDLSSSGSGTVSIQPREDK
jgi:hypothetical protein